MDRQSSIRSRTSAVLEEPKNLLQSTVCSGSGIMSLLAANRRGVRQRMQEAEATQLSALADYLLRRWAWGYLSLPEVQRLASLAEQDAEAAGLKRGQGLLSQLSGLGGDSHLSHNMLRTQTWTCHVQL